MILEYRKTNHISLSYWIKFGRFVNKEIQRLGKELWKDVNNWEDRYMVSSSGLLMAKEKIISGKKGILKTKNKMILKCKPNSRGYKVAALQKKGFPITHVKIHKLVAEAFIPNPENKPYVNHINRIKTDNHFSNLEWVTTRENISHLAKTSAVIPALKLVGASYSKRDNKWIAQVQIDGKHIFLGRHRTQKDAHNRYVVELEKHGIKNKYADI